MKIKQWIISKKYIILMISPASPSALNPGESTGKKYSTLISILELRNVLVIFE